MSNQVKIGVVVGIVILGILAAGGWIMMANKNKQMAANTEEKQIDQTTQSRTTNKQSLESLMKMNSNQTCTFSDEMGNSGTVYASSGKSRADLVGSANGQETSTHMISDGSTIYMWFDGQEQGFKMPMAEIEKYSQQGQENRQENVDVNKQMDVDCQNWSADNSKFEIPDMKFMDFGEMMKGLDQISPMVSPSATGRMMAPSVTGSVDDMKTSQCAACNSLSGESKTACIQALDCE